MRLKLKSITISICWLCTIFLYLYVDRSTYNSRKKFVSYNEIDHNTWKTILIWTDFFHSREVWKRIIKRNLDGECEENRCRFSLKHTDIIDADAVLFNGYNLRSRKGLEVGMIPHVFPLPLEITRNPDQVYVFYSMEPPTKLDAFHLTTLPANFFNWTMGYRTDSDVYEPSGVVTKKTDRKHKLNYITKEELLRKNFSVWIGSSCYKRTPYLRENFLKALKKEVDIHAFGECGKRCDNNSRIEIFGQEVGEPACEALVKDYVFYLALENSLCKDYVTEKIFKAWLLGAIPVVFGAGNYTSFAPPNSYIDYNDFDSVTDLANYMKKVATDLDLYNQYFKWKENYDIEVGSPYKPFICDLCKKLHDNPLRRKSYPDIHRWFIKQGDCKYTVNY